MLNAEIRLLVTGGCGFIGSNFVEYISRMTNWEICNIDNLSHSSNTDVCTIGNFRKGDICNESFLEEVFEEWEPNVIVHMAAETHVDTSITDPKKFIMTNVFGTLNMLEASRKYGVTLFIQFGTDEEYGQLGASDSRDCFYETDRLDPSSPYSASKVASSLLALSYYKTYGLPVIVVRPCNNFGPYQHEEKFIPKAICNVLNGLPIPVYGSGNNIREWLYVEETCWYLKRLIENGKSGEIYNIGHGFSISNYELAKKIINLLKKDVREYITYVQDRPGHDFRYHVNCLKLDGVIGDSSDMSEDKFDECLIKTIEYYKNKLSK